jgi:hypothetical protein
MWAFFFIVLLIIMLVSLAGKTRPSRRQPQTAPTNEERIETWLRLIRQAERDEYFKWRLAQSLQRLTVDIIAYRIDRSPGETRQQLKQGEFSLPPELQAYFQASLKPLGYLPHSRRFFSAKAGPSPLDLDPARVAQFLENLNSDIIIIFNNPKEMP